MTTSDSDDKQAPQRDGADSVALVDPRAEAGAEGAAQRSIRLKGKLSRDGGDKVAVELRLTDAGLWLVDVDAQPPEPLVDLLQVDSLRYRPGALGDGLSVGDADFGIPTGKGSAVREIIAQARLRGPRARSWPTAGPLLEARKPRHDAWLSGWLEPDERLLAWLRSGSTLSIASSIADYADEELSFALTTERAVLVAVSEVGDVALETLPTEALIVEGRVGRDEVRCGKAAWRTALTNEEAYRRVAELLALPRQERILQLAAQWFGQGERDGDGAARARALLRGLAAEEHAWAAVTLHTMGYDQLQDRELDRCLRALVADNADTQLLVAWSKRWRPSDERALELIERLRNLGLAGAASLAWHELIHERSIAAQPALALRVELDLAFAAHLEDAQQPYRACKLLEGTLEQLPPAELHDLIPPSELADDTCGQSARLCVLDRLAALRGDVVPDTATLLELAKLQPMSLARIDGLRERAERDLALRLTELRDVVAPGGLVPPQQTAAPDAAPAALSDEQLFEQLQHPVAREGGALGKLQSFLATVEAPDHSSLKSYCERLLPSRSEAAHRALTDATMALGMKAVEAYVSRGDKSVGVRAYEGTPSFVVIGGDHFDRDSPHRLRDVELRFIVGAEMAHLRFGHSRVTSSEVWSGAFEKGKETVGLLLAVLPALKLFKFGGKIASAAEVLDGGAVGTVIDTATKLVSRSSKDVPPNRSVDRGTEELVAAHRVTQFTADRAGLLLCGDLRSAIRAMFLLRPEYAPELAVAERIGLPKTVTRRSSEGELLYEDLAVRVGALATFFLSEDYARLRVALYGTDGS